MASSDNSPSVDPVEEDIKDMKIKSVNSSDDEIEDTIALSNRIKEEEEVDLPFDMSTKTETRPHASTLVQRSRSISSFDGAADDGSQILGGDITVKQEPGRPPKLERKASQKVTARSPPLFDDYEDKTHEARSTFDILDQCTYASKALGKSPFFEDEENGCECAEEWGKQRSCLLSGGEYNYADIRYRCCAQM